MITEVKLNNEEIEIIIESLYTEMQEAEQDWNNDERRGRDTTIRQNYITKIESLQNKFIKLSKE